MLPINQGDTVIKAIVYKRYGTTDVLEMEEVEKPTPKDNEVLIEIHATSVNASDWELLTGKPIYTRLWGLLKPKHTILGSDIAGRVVAVGKYIREFRPGDEVFGDNFGYWGGFAEFACAAEHTLQLKPHSLSFEDVASLPQASIVALQGLGKKRKIQAGQKILINGAGGGAGTFAVQLAKLFGAEVTGVDRAEKLDLVRALGADHVIDYQQQDFTNNGQHYDLILDLAAYRSIFSYFRALKSKGIYFMIGGSMTTFFQTVIFGPLLSLFSSKKLGVLAVQQNQQDLLYIKELFDEGKIAAVIDKTYPLDEVPNALRYLGEGNAKGKLVISLKV